MTEGATVVVANASGVPGSAGRMSTALGAAGFTMAEATNATSAQLEQSVVYYDPACRRGQAVAEFGGADRWAGSRSSAVPTPVPIEGGALNGSGVVVMLGTAQADKTLEELTADPSRRDPRRREPLRRSPARRPPSLPPRRPPDRSRRRSARRREVR